MFKAKGPRLLHAGTDVLSGVTAVCEFIEGLVLAAIDGGIGLVVGGIVVGIMATGIPGAIWGAMPWVKKEEPAAH